MRGQVFGRYPSGSVLGVRIRGAM